MPRHDRIVGQISMVLQFACLGTTEQQSLRSRFGADLNACPLVAWPSARMCVGGLLLDNQTSTILLYLQRDGSDGLNCSGTGWIYRRSSTHQLSSCAWADQEWLNYKAVCGLASKNWGKDTRIRGTTDAKILQMFTECHWYD